MHKLGVIVFTCFLLVLVPLVSGDDDKNTDTQEKETKNVDFKSDIKLPKFEKEDEDENEDEKVNINNDVSNDETDSNFDEPTSEDLDLKSDETESSDKSDTYSIIESVNKKTNEKSDREVQKSLSVTAPFNSNIFSESVEDDTYADTEISDTELMALLDKLSKYDESEIHMINRKELMNVKDTKNQHLSTEHNTERGNNLKGLDEKVEVGHTFIEKEAKSKFKTGNNENKDNSNLFKVIEDKVFTPMKINDDTSETIDSGEIRDNKPFKTTLRENDDIKKELHLVVPNNPITSSSVLDFAAIENKQRHNAKVSHNKEVNTFGTGDYLNRGKVIIENKDISRLLKSKDDIQSKFTEKESVSDQDESEESISQESINIKASSTQSATQDVRQDISDLNGSSKHGTDDESSEDDTNETDSLNDRTEAESSRTIINVEDSPKHVKEKEVIKEVIKEINTDVSDVKRKRNDGGFRQMNIEANNPLKQGKSESTSQNHIDSNHPLKDETEESSSEEIKEVKQGKNGNTSQKHIDSNHPLKDETEESSSEEIKEVKQGKSENTSQKHIDPNHPLKDETDESSSEEIKEVKQGKNEIISPKHIDSNHPLKDETEESSSEEIKEVKQGNSENTSQKHIDSNHPLKDETEESSSEEIKEVKQSAKDETRDHVIRLNTEVNTPSKTPTEEDIDQDDIDINPSKHATKVIMVEEISSKHLNDKTVINENIESRVPSEHQDDTQQSKTTTEVLKVKQKNSEIKDTSEEKSDKKANHLSVNSEEDTKGDSLYVKDFFKLPIEKKINQETIKSNDPVEQTSVKHVRQTNDDKDVIENREEDDDSQETSEKVDNIQKIFEEDDDIQKTSEEEDDSQKPSEEEEDSQKTYEEEGDSQKTSEEENSQKTSEEEDSQKTYEEEEDSQETSEKEDDIQKTFEEDDDIQKTSEEEDDSQKTSEEEEDSQKTSEEEDDSQKTSEEEEDSQKTFEEYDEVDNSNEEISEENVKTDDLFKDPKEENAVEIEQPVKSFIKFPTVSLFENNDLRIKKKTKMTAESFYLDDNDEPEETSNILKVTNDDRSSLNNPPVIGIRKVNPASNIFNMAEEPVKSRKLLEQLDDTIDSTDDGSEASEIAESYLDGIVSNSTEIPVEETTFETSTSPEPIEHIEDTTAIVDFTPADLACMSNPCANGTCQDVSSGGYICLCNFGFTGNNCENTIDPCIMNPCPRGATCLPDGASRICVCRDGFKGPNCEQGDVLVVCNDLTIEHNLNVDDVIKCAKTVNSTPDDLCYDPDDTIIYDLNTTAEAFSGYIDYNQTVACLKVNPAQVTQPDYCDDRINRPWRKATSTVCITFNKPPEFLPSFPVTVNIRDVQIGDPLMIVQTVDDLSFDTPSLSIEDVFPDVYKPNFRISGAGEISFGSIPDTIPNDSLNLLIRIKVNDNGMPPLEARATVNITLVDIDLQCSFPKEIYLGISSNTTILGLPLIFGAQGTIVVTRGSKIDLQAGDYNISVQISAGTVASFTLDFILHVDYYEPSCYNLSPEVMIHKSTPPGNCFPAFFCNETQTGNIRCSESLSGSLSPYLSTSCTISASEITMEICVKSYLQNVNVKYDVTGTVENDFGVTDIVTTVNVFNKPPVILNTPLTTNVSEDAPFGIEVLTIEVEDDFPSPVIELLGTGQSIPFSLNGTDIFLSGKLDFEIRNRYDLTILVS
ncbi:Hypothetical predicted protein [Mytilus galloprovincialis]|uniref:EGF-like domain-containing protein n=1 Tax=Mytilus galloprovincialis TaxID=29158 RepID=A0A8B6DVQ5_MYTGA|nr:Hypothetical predicted protein [Mytilus galloprovincialis]